MTEQHPLTTAQIKKLAKRYTLNVESGEYFFGEDDVRAAYDLAIDQCEDAVRFAYDLAIAHFSKWIYENGAEYFIQHHEHNIKTDLDTIVADFRKSMRPQEDN